MVGTDFVLARRLLAGTAALALVPGGPAYARDLAGNACQAAVISDWTGMLQGDPSVRTTFFVAGPWAAPGARIVVDCWVQRSGPNLAEPTWRGWCRFTGDDVVADYCDTYFLAHRAGDLAWLCTRAVATWPDGTVATAATDADGDAANGVQCPSLFWF